MANNQQWNTAGARVAANISLSVDYFDLAAPVISATAASSSSITIDLVTPTTGASTYSVERSADQVNWTPIETNLTEAEFPFSSPGLDAGETYYYRPIAYNASGAPSPYGGIVSATTDALQPPTQAPDFTYDQTSTTITATVSNGYGATSYQVRVNAGTPVDGLTIGGQTPESTVNFSMRGRNADGDSPWSAPVSVTLDAAGTGTTDPSRIFTLTRTFEGTDGATAYGPDGFDGDAGRTTYSTEQVYAGTTSARMQLLVSDTDSSAGGSSNGGFGNWGGRINFPVRLKQGDEIWIKFRMFFPAGFSFYSGTLYDRIKFTRLKSRTEAGGNAGLLDVYWARANETKSYMHIKEGSPLGYWKTMDDPQVSHITGEWVCFNWYYYLHSDDAQAVSRWWRNDYFFRELNNESKAANLSRATDTIDWLNIFTYWNGVVPQDQHCYFDDLVITTDRSQTVIDPVTGHPWLGN